MFIKPAEILHLKNLTTRQGKAILSPYGMDNTMMVVQSKYCQPNKDKWFGNFWTGTRRISRSDFIDDFGEKLTVSEFSKKIGSKVSVSILDCTKF